MPENYPQGNHTATEMYLIAPNDGADLARPVRAINVTVAGNLHYVDDVGNENTIPVPVGVMQFRPTRVKTGTTATVYGMR